MCYRCILRDCLHGLNQSIQALGPENKSAGCEHVGTKSCGDETKAAVQRAILNNESPPCAYQDEGTCVRGKHTRALLTCRNVGCCVDLPYRLEQHNHGITAVVDVRPAFGRVQRGRIAPSFGPGSAQAQAASRMPRATWEHLQTSKKLTSPKDRDTR